MATASATDTVLALLDVENLNLKILSRYIERIESDLKNLEGERAEITIEIETLEVLAHGIRRRIYDLEDGKSGAADKPKRGRGRPRTSKTPEPNSPSEAPAGDDPQAGFPPLDDGE